MVSNVARGPRALQAPEWRPRVLVLLNADGAPDGDRAALRSLGPNVTAAYHLSVSTKVASDLIPQVTWSYQVRSISTTSTPITTLRRITPILSTGKPGTAC